MSCANHSLEILRLFKLIHFLFLALCISLFTCFLGAYLPLVCDGLIETPSAKMYYADYNDSSEEYSFYTCHVNERYKSASNSISFNMYQNEIEGLVLEKITITRRYV